MRHTREVLDGGKIRHGLLFDDPPELLDMVCEAGADGAFTRYLGPNAELFGNKYGGHYRDAHNWLGRSDLKSWDQFREASAQVWPLGEDRVKSLLAKLEQCPFVPPRDLRRRSVWRDDGEGDFELDRYVDGRDAWRGPKRRQVIGRQFLTFVIDVAANCLTSADKMYWRAAVAVACANVLEGFGYGVEVLASANLINTLHPPGRRLQECDWDDNGDLYEYDPFGAPRDRRRQKVTPGVYQDVYAGVWVKRPDDPVDMGALTAVCSPWFFRLGFFGMFGLVPDTIARKSLGSCVGLEDALIDELTGQPGDRERVKLEKVWTEQAAAELFKATLRKFADPEWLADNPEPGAKVEFDV